MRLRKIAAVSSLALAASVLGTVAPATAQSAELNYDCKLPSLEGFGLGQLQFPTTFDTAFGSAATFGETKAITVKVAVPSDLSNTLANLKGTLEGTLQGKASFGGQVVTYTAQIAKQTAVAGQPMVVTATGKIAAAKPGATSVVAGDYTANLKAVVDLGSGPAPMDVQATCAAPAEGDKTIDAVNVAKASTKSTIKVATKKGKGTATVTVKGQNGTKPGGKVTVKIGKKAFKGTVKNGVAKIKVKGLKKGKNKVTGKYTGDKFHAGSKIKGNVKVK